jgi:aminoglycoside N3'-acetyltransferase
MLHGLSGIGVFAALKQRVLPDGAHRTWNRLRNRLLRRVTARRVARDLRRLGLAEGDLVCVHSALSGVGYLAQGADTVIEALFAVVGERGTVMMPTFCGGGSTYKYVVSNPPPFDPVRAPVTTGTLPERFRRWPGVRRSLHPTHSVAARGPLAGQLLEGHEHSPTPFGDETPYGRLAGLGGKVLLLNSNGNSMLHWVQDVVDWPHRYLPDPFELQVVGPDGQRAVRTLVHSAAYGHKVVLPGIEQGEWRVLHLPWYSLQFDVPASERQELARLRPDAARKLAERQAWFEREGIVRFGRVGYAPAALLDAAPFSKRIAEDLRDELASHPACYERTWLEALIARSGN